MMPPERAIYTYNPAMKIGLYSITYLGIWYRGPALSIEELIERAKRFGYDGIEIDGKRPHGNPLDLRTRGSRSTPLRRTTISAAPCPSSARASLPMSTI
jgi:hypothetical protein